MGNLEKLRKEYSDQGINKQTVCADPFAQFEIWFNQAIASGLSEPNGFALATATLDGKPSQRTVLLKGHDNLGFVFYTNHSSRKGKQLACNRNVSMLFPWYALHRQIHIEGRAEKVDDALSQQYFHSRPRGSQIGAWASVQSMEIESREYLEKQAAIIEKQFTDQAIPLPPFWGGYRVTPSRFEFWQGRTHRLHDRIVYSKMNEKWQISRLSP